MQAFKLEIIEDTGAYAKAGPPVLMRAIVHAPGPYEFPHVEVSGKVVYTNNPPCAAMRGFGAPQVLITLETQLREICNKLDISPVELRKKNGFEEGSETGTGQILETDPGYQKVLDEVEPIWEEWKKEIENKAGQKENIEKGVGMAGTWFGIGKTGLPSSDTMRTELTSDGEIILYNGVADIGQGSTTAMRMITAEELNQEPEDIEVVEMDTRYTEDCDLTCASRQTLFGGSAAKRSAEKLAESIKERIASLKGCKKDEVRLAPGRMAIVDGEEILLSEVTEGESIEEMGEFVTPERVVIDQKEVKGTPYLDYTYGATVVEVEVDTETGSVEVGRVKTLFNTGKAINPLYVEGQLDGGVGWGVSQALKEEYIPAETDSFTDYIILGALETPEIDSSFVDVPQSSGEYGQVGIGECAHYPILPAIANAINDACGVWIRDLPFSSERVRKKISGGW
ncbi:hypothetical protein AKJ61_03110 [candidate division MSBL1 archaeon SCGC-AAA259B11]|uniref:Uncharacterized protein n=1 Tax=candidate division MSBL1 archaeon SCGC-AAA259B11 TaxID=1698260 RepID=A0A133U592_9EURY|nr:hypothetical protein AKJ61_03110 [candidate division MSBL1 archaeon SCGC-AAA259B11]